MINKDVLTAMRLRTCAICVQKISDHELLSEPSAPFFKVFGTGFLVGPLTVITNRHVLDNVKAYIEKESLPKERRHVMFIYSDESGIKQKFRKIGKILKIKTPHFDIGLLSFRAEEEDPIHSLSPVTVTPDFSAEVGDPVGVYGYAFGENLLKREFGEVERLYRAGPVLQQGWISAISPFEHATFVDRVLLDVHTARGMSGSPVFNPQTGAVLAIHDAGMGDPAVAFAIPISAQLISELLVLHSNAPLNEELTAQISLVSLSRTG